jgi:flap endonuclease-1
MGIKNLNSAIKSLCPRDDIFSLIPLSLLTGKTIGIDWFNWFFTYAPISVKIVTDNMEDKFGEPDNEKIKLQIITELTTFSNKLLKHGINILWICDGLSQDNKGVTKVERRKKREDLFNKVKNTRETLLSQNVLERDPTLMEYYEKNKARSVYISQKTRLLVENFIKETGMPFIFSDDEAENLGSSLVKENKIHALWTSDTDTYPLECNLVVKGFIKKNNKEYIKSVDVDKIRTGLKLTCEEFRDYCILLGTDFNDPIKGIGPKKGYAMITAHRNLETAEQNSKFSNEIRNMKYLDVRKQLTPYKTNFKREDFMLNSEKEIKLEDEILDLPGVISMIIKIKQFKH